MAWFHIKYHSTNIKLKPISFKSKPIKYFQICACNEIVQISAGFTSGHSVNGFKLGEGGDFLAQMLMRRTKFD